LGRQYRLSAKSIGLLIIVAAIAASLSFASFEYSNYTSGQMLRIASENIRSNAMIQAHDLERILANKMDSAATNLGLLAQSPSIQDTEMERAVSMIESAQSSTSEFTDFYMWLDSSGKISWISGINQTTYEQMKETDLSQRQYFIQARDTQRLYYSTAVDSNDGVSRIYISRPIVSQDAGRFLGIVVAGIRLDGLGEFLENELAPEFRSTIGMLDRDGIVLYTSNQSLISEGVFGNEFQRSLPAELKPSFNNFIRDSMAGESGVHDISAAGSTATIAYQSIRFEGQPFGTLYIVTPHQLADSVVSLVNQQKNFSTIMMTVIAGVAIALGILIVVWNRRLEGTVHVRTSELRSKSAELKKSYDSLSVAKQQLEVHATMQKEFINIAAHELRTPTQAILGYAELLQTDPEERKEMIAGIYRNSIRLQRLTSDILDVTRIESESLRLDKEEFNMGEVVEGVIRDANAQMSNGKIEFVYNVEESVVHADRGRITQVFANLLDNAIKFTKQGKIEITVYRANGDIAISIRDSGDGIDANIMPRLFSKFATKSDKGTGLGLFISRSIIDAHGGRIWCYNNSDGKGATFAFSIPAFEKELEPKSQAR
jgi:signal transduction histidine kinase